MPMARERRETGNSQLNRLTRPKLHMMGGEGKIATNRDGATSAGIGTMGHVVPNPDRVIPASRALLVTASMGRGTTRLEIAPSEG